MSEIAVANCNEEETLARDHSCRALLPARRRASQESIARCFERRHRELVYRNLYLGELYAPDAPGGGWYVKDVEDAVTFYRSGSRFRFSLRCREVENSIAYCFERRHRELVYRNLYLGEFYAPKTPGGGLYVDYKKALIYNDAHDAHSLRRRQEVEKSVAKCFERRHRDLVYRNLYLGEFYVPVSTSGVLNEKDQKTASIFRRSHSLHRRQEVEKSIAKCFERRHRDLVYRNLYLGEFYVPRTPDGGRVVEDIEIALILFKSHCSRARQEFKEIITKCFEKRHRDLIYFNLHLGQYYVPAAPGGGWIEQDLRIASIFYRSHFLSRWRRRIVFSRRPTWRSVHEQY